MKVYISGPITGMPDLNRGAFYAAETELVKQGHRPVNPFRLNAALGDEAPWEEYLKRDIRELTTCDAIQLLQGFNTSKGAMLELIIAQNLNLEILPPLQVAAYA